MRAVAVVVLSVLALIVSASAQSCTFGARRCAAVGGGIETCTYADINTLVWVSTPCGNGTACANVGTAFVCALNPSTACTPNSRQCVSSNQYHVCNNAGTQWGPNQPCPTGKECANGQCQTVTATCSPSGAMQCTNSTFFRQCSNGKWYLQSCAPGTVCGPYIGTTIVCHF